MFTSVVALLLTIVVEFLIILIFLRKEPLKIFFYSCLINTFTLPLATYLYFNGFPSFVLLEVVVFLVEAVLIKLLLKISFPKSLLFSLVANLVTTLMSIFFFQ